MDLNCLIVNFYLFYLVLDQKQRHIVFFDLINNIYSNQYQYI
jgi:hypothetical protein